MLSIIKYPSNTSERYIRNLKQRLQVTFTDLETTVAEIIKQVQKYGDDAIVKITQQYEDIPLDKSELQISEEEILAAFNEVEREFIIALHEAIENIYYFHEKQKRNSWFTTERDGVILGQKLIPLEKIGIYIPGGKTVSPSAVLMNAIPARVAGVEEIIMVTPPNPFDNISPHILVAAREVGIEKIYTVGGAQAIAALAFGTNTISRVDKIIGPGNIYVSIAKKQVFGLVDIDMFTGPAEIAILADDKANPVYIAADMLSQTERSEMAYAILITTSENLAQEVILEIERELPQLTHKRIIERSLNDYGAIIIVPSIEKGIELINDIAPQRLSIMTENPWELIELVKHTGIIYLGAYSPDPIGDYFAGPNNILPAGGTARFHSSLSVDDFIKKVSVISYTRKRLEKDKNRIIKLAELEGLEGHSNAIKRRFV